LDRSHRGAVRLRLRDREPLSLELLHFRSGLLDTRYVSAGLLFVILVAIPAALMVLGAVYAWRLARPRASWSQRVWARQIALGVAVLGFFLAAGLYFIAEAMKLTANDPNSWRDATRFLMAVSVSVLVLLLLPYPFPARAPDDYVWWFEFLIRSALGVLLLLILLSRFSTTVYTRIRPEYGGGAAPKVHFILRPSARASGKDTVGKGAATVGLAGIPEVDSSRSPESADGLLIEERNGFFRLLMCVRDSLKVARRDSLQRAAQRDSLRIGVLERLQRAQSDTQRPVLHLVPTDVVAAIVASTVSDSQPRMNSTSLEGNICLHKDTSTTQRH
jgi:hypothetical protein